MNARRRPKSVRLTAAQALVRYLQAQYSERDGRTRRLIPAVFGIFGHGNVTGLGQALYEYGTDLPYHKPCNEQSMVHTAAGFARANSRLATLACASSIGPGATNMVTGAATATINRLPVLLLPADYYANRRQGPVLQQLEYALAGDVSVNDCFRPVSRFFDRILRPEQLLTALPEAMRVLLDPVETGAVTVAVAQDTQLEACDFPVHFFDERVWPVERRAPDPQRLGEAVALLKQARRPLIVAGGGVHYSEAWDALQAFAEGCGIPVSETFAGKGALRGESALYLGGQGVSGTTAAVQAAAKADLVIAVGTRLADFTTGSQTLFQCPQVGFLGINVCGRDAYKQGALPLVADARQALRSLARACRQAGIEPRPGYLREMGRLRQAWQRVLDRACSRRRGEAMNEGQVVRVLNEEARPGDVAVAAAGTLPADLLKAWDATGDRACHLEFGYSCMGYEIPASLGMRLAQPRGEIFAVVGDGTYLMNPMELVTAAQEGLKITVVVSQNHGFQCIRFLQLNRTGHAFGNEFRRRDPRSGRLEGEFLDIDFAGNAESMGARAWRVETPDELRQALQEARRVRKRPCVIVAEVEKYRFLPGSGAWIDFGVAETSADPATRKLRREYERHQRRQRFHY